MTTKTYDVLLRVPAETLPTILQALAGAGELVSVVPTNEEPRKRANSGLVKRNRKTGISGADLVLEVAAGGAEKLLSAFDKAFSEKGFAPTSAKARISELIKSGKLVQVRKDVYQIAPKKKVGG